jgi:hypothetical protein
MPGASDARHRAAGPRVSDDDLRRRSYEAERRLAVAEAWLVERRIVREHEAALRQEHLTERVQGRERLG